MGAQVIPSAYTRGRCGKVEFPTWLGKNSNANKQKRLLKDLQVRICRCLAVCIAVVSDCAGRCT